jgi:hypothetical protein
MRSGCSTRPAKQCEQVLVALKARAEGITSLDAARLDPPVMSLAERIRDLREQGIDIRTEKVQTANGNCGRYILVNLQLAIKGTWK